jgi:hypothetical protein
MRTSRICLAVAFLAVTIPRTAMPADNVLSNKAFINAGAGAFIGQIQSVDVVSKSQLLETGSVEIAVGNVISGSLTVSTIKLPYQRALAPSDEQANWDLVQPMYTSLTDVPSSEKLLIYFQENSDKSISLFPASNSVQDVSSGLFLATIDRPSYGWFGWGGGEQDVKLTVKEVVFGWVDGTTVKLPLRLGHGCSNAVQKHQGNTKALEEPELFGWDRNKTLLIAFDKSGICGIQEPNKQLLDAIKYLDSK